MDSTQLDAITDEIGTVIQTAGTVTEAVAPQYAPFVILGMAAAKALPSLIDDVNVLINSSAPPTADQISAFSAKLTALANPSAL